MRKLNFLILLIISALSVNAQSGTAGDLSWEIADSTLTISGNGAIPDYTQTDNKAPWLDYQEMINSLVVDDGVTKIGNWALQSCTNLSTVSLPTSLDTIGDASFYACTGLDSVYIPEGTTSIGMGTFMFCRNGLNSISMPSTLETIGTFAFLYDSTLTDIYVNAEMPPLAANVFMDTTYTNATLHVPASTKAIYEAADTWKSFTNIVEMLPGGTADDLTWVLDNGTLTISGTGDMPYYNAMLGEKSPWLDYSTDITSLIIEEGVTDISYAAFGDCKSLVEVSLPTSLNTIAAYAFYNCSSLDSVYIPEGVHAIFGSVFMAGYLASDAPSSLRAVSIPSTVDTLVTSIFTSCEAVTDIYLYAETPPSCGTDIMLSGGFSATILAATLHVPAGTKAVYEAADTWADFTNIVEILPGGTVDDLTWVLDNGTLTISGIGDMPYYNAMLGEKSPWLDYSTDITSLIIEEGVTDISYAAFGDCKNLAEVSLPTSLDTIAAYAFYNCSSLDSVYIPEGVHAIFGSIFMAGYLASDDPSSLRAVSIPSTVDTIVTSIFTSCEAVTDIYLYAETPPSCGTDIMSGGFSATILAATLHVPAGTKAVYEAADTWADFYTITEMTTTSSVDIINEEMHIYISGEQLVIEGTPVTQVYVYNISGILALSAKSPNINISELPSGIYFVKTEYGTTKVLKQ